MQLAWLLNGNSRLAGKSPREMIEIGDLDAAIASARAYGEQGAD